MVSANTLKEILIANEHYILNQLALPIAPRERIILPTTLNKVVIFFGVRRSGKSYLLFNLFKQHHPHVLYVDFEDERLADFQAEDFARLHEAFLDLKPDLTGKKLTFLLDEVQNVPGWEKFARRMVERDNAAVFVTGSSSKMLPQEIQTALRVRSWSIEVTPFSFREILLLKKFNPADPSLAHGLAKAKIKKIFDDYSVWGGFPEILLASSDFERGKILKEYMEAMFFKDLAQRFNVSNIALLNLLMDNLFHSFSCKMSLTSFYKQFKQKFPFSKDTLFLYYKHLLDSMLVFEVKKFAESHYKRNRNPTKIYVIDAGLCKKTSSVDQGRILENLVFLELRKTAAEIFYFEEKHECDFIVKIQDGQLVPFQVTWQLTEENKTREIEGLKEACQWLHVKQGTILTYDQSGEETIGDIHIKILPVWQWLIKN